MKVSELIDELGGRPPLDTNENEYDVYVEDSESFEPSKIENLRWDYENKKVIIEIM